MAPPFHFATGSSMASACLGAESRNASGESSGLLGSVPKALEVAAAAAAGSRCSSCRRSCRSGGSQSSNQVSIISVISIILIRISIRSSNSM